MSDILQEQADVLAQDQDSREFTARKAAELRGTVYDGRIEEAWWWFCGEGAENITACKCGSLAEYLCDYPVGKGKTCDVGLCEQHRHAIGQDHDLCLIHHAEFQGKARVSAVRPWPPNPAG